MADPDFVNMDVMPTDEETAEEREQEREESNERVENTNTEDLPLAEGTEHQRQVSEDFHKQQEELYRR